MNKLIKLVMALIVSLSIVSLPTGKAQAAGFPDVTSFKKEIDYLTEQKVISGFKDGTFRPSVKLTRAQAVVMIMRAIGMPETPVENPGFLDVSTTTFGYKEIAYAVSLGIINGKSPEQFDPAGNITRAEMATILVNAFEMGGLFPPGFKDVSTKSWAYPYISSLAANNITVGYDDQTFRPKNPIDRAQFSAFLARILNPEFQPSSPLVKDSLVDMTAEANIVDVVKNPDKPIIYFIDALSNSLVMLNLETYEEQFVDLKYPAEKLIIKNGKIFVTQLLQGRSSYNFIDMQKGLINVYDANDLTLLKEVNVNIDPYDIAVDDSETLIISSGSGQHTEVQTYNWKTSEELSSAFINDRKLIELSPTINKVYSVDTHHYTGKIESYTLLDGKITKDVMEPRFFGNELRGYIQFTPDGKYIFNGNGTIYTSSSQKSSDLSPLGQLATPFSTITFDLAGNGMFLADRSNEIIAYDYELLEPVYSMETYGKIDHLFYVEETGELYAFTKLKMNNSAIEYTALERIYLGE
ncbi:S-layer homology domain-containing protein [Paenisporosarcina macmurdoensis]|uniref:S-layer homology domain-containing protein n=1 Tax=Paenisporosarcina macmurdoensis TaxID=212659 RepID=A0ABW1L0I4_9BACL